MKHCGERVYIAIDLKSFYASVECNERGLDPLATNLVVADITRTEKTICLAVSPALKAYGIPGRPRLFEVIEKVKAINADRLRNAPGHTFGGKSCDFNELRDHPEYKLDFIIAPPRMAYYIEYSTAVYKIYTKYIAPADMHVYSVDEVFIDATGYLKRYETTAHGLAIMIIRDVLRSTGITATAGIGTNLYLCKVAMDIVAKKMPADSDGVRIAELDEAEYRKQLWTHTPVTSFWRVGKGTAAKLAANGMMTMGDVARMSLSRAGEDLLYRLFGANAELLIDHAWGWEPVTVADIKAYKPERKGLSSGQVLPTPYTFEKARLAASEMADSLSYSLSEKNMKINKVVLTVGYDVENLRKDGADRLETETDYYGRKVPKKARGTETVEPTDEFYIIENAVISLFDRVVDKNLTVRRINIAVSAANGEVRVSPEGEQLSLFFDGGAALKRDKERKKESAVTNIRERFGKNAILRGHDYLNGATARDRNGQIGGHKK